MLPAEYNEVEDKKETMDVQLACCHADGTIRFFKQS
jgi:hypothetical protein